MDVFFFETFEEEERALCSYLPSDISAGFTWKTIQEHDADIPPAPVISLRTQSKIPLEWAPQLTAILSRSTGYDHLTDYREATGVELPCGYLPLYCHRAVAEQAALLWLSLQRKLLRQIRQFHTFHRDGLTGTETQGKNLLVVGAGHIGGEVASIGQGLGMSVACVDLEVKHPDFSHVQIEQGIGWADIIVCAMSLNEGNAGYFSEELLNQTRSGAIFVNVSRGELSPSSILLKMLDQEQLAGVALDVFDQETRLGVALRESRNVNDPEVQAALKLSRHANAICTPHNAFNTEESVQRKSYQSIQQLIHFKENHHYIWPIPV